MLGTTLEFPLLSVPAVAIHVQLVQSPEHSFVHYPSLKLLKVLEFLGQALGEGQACWVQAHIVE